MPESSRRRSSVPLRYLRPISAMVTAMKRPRARSRPKAQPRTARSESAPPPALALDRLRLAIYHVDMAVHQRSGYSPSSLPPGLSFTRSRVTPRRTLLTILRQSFVLVGVKKVPRNGRYRGVAAVQTRQYVVKRRGGLGRGGSRRTVSARRTLPCIFAGSRSRCERRAALSQNRIPT
jgi:hypothetical protein